MRDILIAIMGMHYLGMVFCPLPERMDMNDMKKITEYISLAPLGFLLSVMFAHIGGAFIAGVFTT